MAPNGVAGVRWEQRGWDAFMRYADPKVFPMETWGHWFPGMRVSVLAGA